MGGLEMRYFVLKPKAKSPDDEYANASQEAMKTYSECIRPYNALLADQLLAWAHKEAIAQDLKA